MTMIVLLVVLPVLQMMEEFSLHSSYSFCPQKEMEMVLMVSSL